MPFGALRSDLQHHYYEQFLYVAPAVSIAQGSSANINLGSLTMPWAGDVIFDGWLNMYYDQGATILGADINQATAIGATNFWTGRKTESSGNGGWVAIPCFGRWASLAAGTFFQLTIRVTVGICNGRAVADHFAGSLRAQAA